MLQIWFKLVEDFLSYEILPRNCDKPYFEVLYDFINRIENRHYN